MVVLAIHERFVKSCLYTIIFTLYLYEILTYLNTHAKKLFWDFILLEEQKKSVRRMHITAIMSKLSSKTYSILFLSRQARVILALKIWESQIMLVPCTSVLCITYSFAGGRAMSVPWGSAWGTWVISGGITMWRCAGSGVEGGPELLPRAGPHAWGHSGLRLQSPHRHRKPFLWLSWHATRTQSKS